VYVDRPSRGFKPRNSLRSVKTSNDQIESASRAHSAWIKRLHCLVAAPCVNVKMSVVARNIRGISTVLEGMPNSAELSFQQAIRSPTATANGNDRQTLLWHRRPLVLPYRTLWVLSAPNPEEQVPTNRFISTKIPK
jgi:hypothetical protein